VEGGQKAIIFSRISGVLPEVYGEGWHVLAPWLHVPHVFNVRTRPTSIPSLTGSKGSRIDQILQFLPLYTDHTIGSADLQMVNITLRVLTKPKWEKLPQIYKKLGTDYDQRVLPSIVNEVLKGVVVRDTTNFSLCRFTHLYPPPANYRDFQARFNAAQLITQRELVSGMIQDRLRERAADFFIDLDDVSIVRPASTSPNVRKILQDFAFAFTQTHLSFGREYTAAIEAKQVGAHQLGSSMLITHQ
jgi:hypothetical protein